MKLLISRHDVRDFGFAFGACKYEADKWAEVNGEGASMPTKMVVRDCPLSGCGRVAYRNGLCWFHDQILMAQNKAIKQTKWNKRRRLLHRFFGI